MINIYDSGDEVYFPVTKVYRKNIVGKILEKLLKKFGYSEIKGE